MTGIWIRRLVRGIALFWLFLVLQACSSVAYLPGQQTVGRLRTIGPNVFYQEKPARDGQMVRVGHHLRTGADSSAYVFFLNGGFVHLDADTHPYWEVRWDNRGCRIRKLGLDRGQFYHEAGDQCRTTTRTIHAEFHQAAAQRNISNLRVDGESVLTQLAGNTKAEVNPVYDIEPRQQIRVSTVGVEEVKTLTDPELQAVTRWRNRFPAPCPSGGGECAPPAGTTAGQCTD